MDKATEEKLTKSLIEFITKKNDDNGNTDLKIENIRFWDDHGAIYAYADVSFTWYLNGWEKPTVLNDTIFLYRNEEWYTPTFF